MITDYDYEGSSFDGLTSDQSEALEFLNNAHEDGVEVQEWYGDQRTFRGNWTAGRSWKRRSRQKIYKIEALDV